jgi:predicted aspartyl protease
MLTMLRVNGSAPIPVVFDTGTSSNLVDLKIATSLHLPRIGPSDSVDGAGHPVSGYATVLRNASLSGVAIQDAPATAVDYNQTDEVGIFGPNSFPGELVRLEGPQSRLSLLPIGPDILPSCMPFQYLGTGDDALPSATIEIGAVKIPAILDTGNDSPIILPTEYINQIPLENSPARIGTVFTAAGKQPLFGARLNGTMTIGSVKLDHPEIHFAKDDKPNIGFPILRGLMILMDPSGHRDWILKSDGRNTCSTAE